MNFLSPPKSSLTYCIWAVLHSVMKSILHPYTALNTRMGRNCFRKTMCTFWFTFKELAAFQGTLVSIIVCGNILEKKLKGLLTREEDTMGQSSKWRWIATFTSRPVARITKNSLKRCISRWVLREGDDEDGNVMKGLQMWNLEMGMGHQINGIIKGVAVMGHRRVDKTGKQASYESGVMEMRPTQLLTGWLTLDPVS